MMKIEPFGTYRLPLWGRFLVTVCQAIPANWLGKRISFLLRKPVLLSRKGPIDANVQGARFRLQVGDNLSDKRLLCTPGLLDGRERHFLSGVLDREAWLLDIGANIGGYALLMAAVRPDLNILAVEPDPNLFSRLKKNLHLSGFEERVRLLQAAVTGISGPVTLQRDAVNRGKNAIVDPGVPSLPATDAIEVRGMTLLEIMNANHIQRPAAVKLDIEGHELPVLQSFFGQAEKSRWPKLIQLEQHRKHALNEAANLVLEQGYRLVLRTRMNVVLALD